MVNAYRTYLQGRSVHPRRVVQRDPVCIPSQAHFNIGAQSALYHSHHRARDTGNAPCPVRQENIGTAAVAGMSRAVAEKFYLACGTLTISQAGDGLQQTVRTKGSGNVHIGQAELQRNIEHENNEESTA